MPEQSFTGDGSFVVPAGITTVTIECWGAGGGSGASFGDYVKADYTVTPGETLDVNCGAAAAAAADVRRGGTALADRIIVAGAGGRPGTTTYWVSGGSSGTGLGGFLGTNSGGYTVTEASPGTAGTSGAGGTGGAAGTASGAGGTGSGQSGAAGSNGTLGSGGAGGGVYEGGAFASASASGGDGGDGYYGGGGGGAWCANYADITGGTAGSGGHGSSYTGTGTNVVINADSRATASAIVKISWAVDTNVAPNAPVLVSPLDGGLLSTADEIIFEWVFSDSNGGDTQSRWELEVRAVGSGVNTIDLDTASPPGSGWAMGIVGSQQSVTAPAGTLSADDWEYRIVTYDQAPLIGSWSAWRPFVILTPPTAPTITAPAHASTLTSGAQTLTWTVTNQSAYQVRRLLDSTLAELWVGPVVENSSARSDSVTFPTDGQTERLQVRIRYNGVWSSWTSVTVTTDFVPPMTPTLVVTPIDTPGFLAVTVTHPTPSGGAPAVSYTEIWVRTAAGRDPTRTDPVLLSTGQALTIFDYEAASGVTYEYQAAAVAADGETSLSAWEEGIISLGSMFVHDAASPADNIAIYLGEESESYDTRTEIGRYGGGRRRSIRRPGADLAVSFDIARMGRETYYQLRDKTGDTVIVRTPRGRKIRGVISSVEADEVLTRDAVSVQFTVTETTE